LRREDCSTLRRRRAEIARQQIGVFLEVGRRRNEVNSKHDVVDCRAAGLKTLADVLANLVINRKAARALDLELSSLLLSRADELIE